MPTISSGALPLLTLPNRFGKNQVDMGGRLAEGRVVEIEKSDRQPTISTILPSDRLLDFHLESLLVVAKEEYRGGTGDLQSFWGIKPKENSEGTPGSKYWSAWPKQ